MNKSQELVFNRIMEALEQGIVPWKKGWTSNTPVNGKTGRPYHGINFFMLNWAPYADHRWLTFNQIQKMGGKIKKGEKSLPVVFWTLFETGKVKSDGTPEKVPFLKFINVFNVEQCSGFKAEAIADMVNVDEQVNVKAEDVVKEYVGGPTLKRGKECGYSKTLDAVIMPAKNKFTDLDEYYASLFHELVHSTGHETRLNRKSLTEGGTIMGASEKYSFEELIAEFGAAFLCAEVGIDSTLENQAMYIHGWMKYIRNNPEQLVKAASAAQKAADYIRNRTKTEETEESKDAVSA